MIGKQQMKFLGHVIAMGIFAVGLAGCTANQALQQRFVGQPIANVAATMPKYGGQQGTDNRGRPYYRWDFTETETVSVQYSTTRQVPGGPIVSGGLAFGNEERVRHCSVTAYYDPTNMLTTDFKVKRPKGAKCRRMGSYLDGSAFLPTNFPG